MTNMKRALHKEHFKDQSTLVIHQCLTNPFPTLRLKQLLFLILFGMSQFLHLHAQDAIIKGVVLDEEKQPVIGVSVLSVNSRAGTVTDFDGNFSIKCSPNDSLKFRYVGYKTQILNVSTQPMTVVLATSHRQLDEVVVVGYGTQKRSDISTAVSSISAEEIQKSGSSNALEAFQGKVSGVQIQSNDGSLNGNVNIKIRGTNSLSAGTQPLIVIDGVPQPVPVGTIDNFNPMGSINPDDIASVEVLKDAAAAAIYGAEGSNGVILITTKKGDNEKAKFQVSYKHGVDNPVANKYMDVLSPEQYLYKMNNNYGVGTPQSLYIQNAIANKYWNDPTKSVNWMDNIMQQGTRNDVSVSMSGGSKTQNYFLSMGYLSRTGIIRNTAFDRFNMRLNLSQDLNSKMKITGNFSYSSSNDRNPNDDKNGDLVLKALTTSPYAIDPDFVNLFVTQALDRKLPSNMISGHEQTNKYDELNGKMTFEYKIIPDLTFNTSMSARKYFYNSTSYNSPTSSQGFFTNGLIDLSTKDDFNWLSLTQLMYNKSFGKNNFTAMAAFESKDYQSVANTTETTQFDNNNLGAYGVYSGIVTTIPNLTYTEYAMMSYIGRLGYSYDDRYVFSASVRRDGSSRFGANNRWGNFPALSFAWRIKEESFMKDVDFVSDLKYRLSYGVTGNNQLPSYQALPEMTMNKAVLGNTIQTGYNPMNFSNNGLGWETQHQYNTGFDVSILKNRLALTADFYYKRIDDMLVDVNIPSTLGYSQAWENVGSMMNQGMEYALKAVVVDGKLFKWNLNFNIAFNQNKLLALAGGQYQQFYTSGIDSRVSNDILLRVGNPVGVYYGYISNGTYNNNYELLNGYPGSNLSLGDLKVVDVNRDGKIDAYDRVQVANTNPIHTGGLGSNFTLGSFELYAFFRWSYGNEVINGNSNNLVFAKSIYNVLETIYPNLYSASSPNNNYPLYSSGAFGSHVFRSENVEDGSFVRLSTLTLSYSLSKKYLGMFKMTKGKISLTGSNLWLWTRYSGFDVEGNTGSKSISRLAGGLDLSPYPRPQSILLSFELGF
jgi:TonB-dependent starch-binding outer membrane protein SusC